MTRLFCSIFVLGLFVLGLSCQAHKLTNQLTLREGPPLLQGRMSSSLGTVVLKDKRVVVVGGSPTEYPFRPVTGIQTIEILNAQWSQWRSADIDIPYPLSGEAFLLKDGRIFVFASTYKFNPQDNRPEPFAKNPKHPQTGAVSALIIDLVTKKIIPIYRPKNNDPAKGIPPVKGSISIVQRAFATNVQLRDGRIVHIGGRVLASSPPPEIKCEANLCLYCQKETCQPHQNGKFACQKSSDCPVVKGASSKKYLNIIEIYTPPSKQYPQGQVKRTYMPEARRNVGAIELQDGRVFLTGGEGPKGRSPHGAFSTTYFLNPDTGNLQKGPEMALEREDHKLGMLKDGSVIITGGSDRNNVTTNLVEIFLPSTEQIINGEPMDISREDHQPVQLGSWLLFLGGQNSLKSDLIRNSGEAFDATTGSHIASFLLFSRENVNAKNKICPGTKGFAGVDDFAAVTLTPSRVLIVGGQQGCQDRDGDYISPGRGSRRTLFISLPQQ